MRIQLKQLNNKSRKGTYIYIKAPKKRAAYYKLKEGEKIDYYTQYYQDRYIKGKAKGTLQEYKRTYTAKIQGIKTRNTPISRQAQQYLKKIKQKPSIQKSIKKGITHTNIRNALTANNTIIKYATKKLLQDLVLDKGILNILIQEENMKKIAHRLEYRIELKNRKGETIATTGTFNKTPMQVTQELKNSMKKDEAIIKTRTPTTENKLTSKGYQTLQKHKDGKINTINIQIIFRKAQ